MKFKMMIGGIETLLPKADARYFKNDNEIVIYFLQINKDDLQRTKKNIGDAKLRLEGSFLVLLLKDFQYAYDLNQSPTLMDLYMGGTGLGFAFEDENGTLLDIKTPTFHT